MKGKPTHSNHILGPHLMSQWVAGFGQDLREARVLPHSLDTMVATEIRQTQLGVWLIFPLTRMLKLGLRVAFDPAGWRSVRVKKGTSTHLEITAQGGFGVYQVRIQSLDGPATLIRCTTTLTPSAQFKMEAMPRDMCMLDGRLEPYSDKGRLYTCQTGNTAGQMFLQIPGNPGGTVIYFQNFTALTAFCQQTGADLAGSVAAHWPDAGLALPPGERPLAAHGPVIINDAFVELHREVPDGEARAAEWFLDSLGRIYPHLWRPEFEYFDWPAMAKKTLRALTTRTGCCRHVGHKLYLQAYVDCFAKPPESMVQGAVMVPLMEYEAWRKRAVPLLKKLHHVPTSFYNTKLKSPVRWLTLVDFEKEEPSEEEHHFLMDSWYQLHTVMNLGRMGEMGHGPAQKVFLDSLDTLMRVAHHFDYDWPVFYDQRTLAVSKEETSHGEGGEQDAAGLYAHVMLQAYDLTQQKRYLDEAEISANKLKGLAFGVLYQTNTTAMGAVALARLWRRTGKTDYKDLSIMCVASIMAHLWLWHLGPETRTFMGLPPLHDAPYIAFFEEGETLAALQTWLKVLGDGVPKGMVLLLAEYQKHLLSRARYYFPAELPPELIAPEPKESPINRRLPIPLEGLGPAEAMAGTVGQAVYGAGATFILATHCWHRPPGAPFTLFCSYPVTHLEWAGNRRSGTVKLHLSGSPALSCDLRVFPAQSCTADLQLTCAGQRCRWDAQGAEGWSATVPGGSTVMITW